MSKRLEKIFSLVKKHFRMNALCRRSDIRQDWSQKALD